MLAGAAPRGMWVRSEYAGELAVLSAWLSALLPWNVTYSRFGDLGSTLFVRFPFLQVQFTWLPKVRVDGEVQSFRQTGVEVVGGVWVADPITAAAFPEGVGLNVVWASTTWAIGAAVIGLAVLLSLAMYAREDEVEARMPVDPVRTMGALLGVGALVLTVATVLVFRSDLPGIPIPVGTLLLWVFAVTLLTVDRAPPKEAEAEVDAEAEAGTE